MVESIKKPELELSEREQRELGLAAYYVHTLQAYGTDGHGRLVLIHKLFEHIRQLEGYIALIESE